MERLHDFMPILGQLRKGNGPVFVPLAVIPDRQIELPLSSLAPV